MLEIKDLSVRVEGNNVLRRINLTIGKGEVHTLLGPNASGKSTLAHTIMGFPNCEVTGGKIFLGKKEVTDLSVEKRAKLGIALVFQHPPAVKGVSLTNLLSRTSKQTVKAEDFAVDPKLLGRDVNVNFSGGERKLTEIMQVVGLNPRLVILDELDAGLDPKNLERVATVVRDKLLKNGVSILLITHRGDILRFLKPDVAHVMLAGEIVCSSPDWRRVWETIGKFDYEKCKECPFAEER